MTTKTRKTLNAIATLGIGGAVAETVSKDFFTTIPKEQTVALTFWARTNWKAGQAVDPTWHPIVRQEWADLDAAHAELEKIARRQAPFCHNV